MANWGFRNPEVAATDAALSVSIRSPEEMSLWAAAKPASKKKTGNKKQYFLI
jgi:hypothetical protein